MKSIDIFKKMFFDRFQYHCGEHDFHNNFASLSFSFESIFYLELDDGILLTLSDCLSFLKEKEMDFIIFDRRNDVEITDITKFENDYNLLDENQKFNYLNDKFIYFLISEKNQNIIESVLKSLYEEKQLFKPLENIDFCFEFSTYLLPNKTIVLKDISFLKPYEKLHLEKENDLKKVLTSFVEQVDNDYNKFIRFSVDYIDERKAIVNISVYDNEAKEFSAEMSNGEILRKLTNNNRISLFSDQNVNALTKFYTLVKEKHRCDSRIELRKSYEGFMALMKMTINLKNI